MKLLGFLVRAGRKRCPTFLYRGKALGEAQKKNTHTHNCRFFFTPFFPYLVVQKKNPEKNGQMATFFFFVSFSKKSCLTLPTSGERRRKASLASPPNRFWHFFSCTNPTSADQKWIVTPPPHQPVCKNSSISHNCVPYWTICSSADQKSRATLPPADYGALDHAQRHEQNISCSQQSPVTCVYHDSMDFFQRGAAAVVVNLRRCKPHLRGTGSKYSSGWWFRFRKSG